MKLTPLADRVVLKMTEAEAVSYTHLDVYKRQAGLPRRGRGGAPAGDAGG